MRLDPQQLKEEIGFIPTKCQAEILSNLKRFNIIAGGRRSGKSFLVAYIALREILSSNRTIWLVAPNYGLSKIIWTYLLAWSNLHFPDILTVNKSELSLKNDITGSSLELKSADSPSSLKGKGLSLLIIDECGDIPHDIWQTFLRANISEQRPELNGGLGKAILIGNASFNNHWFASEFYRESEDRFSYHLPTAILDGSGNISGSNNPNIVSVSELQEIKSNTSESTWNQQYQAKFVSGEGTVFRNIQDCIERKLKTPTPPRGNRRYLIGVDLARRQDYTVISVMDTSSFELVYFDRFNVIDWAFQKMKIIDVAKRYNNARVIMDSTGLGDVLVNELQREGRINVEGLLFTNESKKELVEKLSLYLEQQRIVLPEVEVLINELEAFEYRLSKTGRVQYSAPSGQHDDCVIALALACRDLPTHCIVNPYAIKKPSLVLAKEAMLNRGWDSDQRIDPMTYNYE